MYSARRPTIAAAAQRAKADVRLVGGQDPQEVFAAIQRFVRDRGYAGIEVKNLKGTPASRTSRYTSLR